MPQLDVFTFSSQIFWLLLTFGTVLCFSCFWFAPRISGAIYARRKKIDDIHQNINKLRTETEELKRECNAILASARQEMADILGQAEEKADQEQRALQASLSFEIKQQLSQWEEDFRQDQKMIQDDILEKIGEMVALCAQQMKDMAYDEQVASFLDEINQSRTKVRH